MDLIIFNLEWMGFNIALGILGVVFGWLFLATKQPLLKVLAAILWMLFLPNTIYVLTDLQYLREQFFEVELLYRPLLLLMYVGLIFFGFVSYIVGLWPWERFIKSLKINSKNKTSLIIISLVIINFLAAFGVVVGKELRTHSWYVFTQPFRVYSDFRTVFQTPIYLAFVIMFGLLNNFIYFGFNKKFGKFLNKKK